MKQQIKSQLIQNTQFFIVALFIFIGCESGKEQGIAEWRGPNRTGIYNETNLLKQWPESGPEQLWVYQGIGKGYGSPSVLGDKIFVNGEQDSSSFLYAFNLQGELLWKAPNGKEFMGEGFSSTYPGARSTPTVVNNLVYTSSGMGRIACFDAETGTEKWAVDIINDLGGSNNYFGYAESLLVDEEKVYSFVGGDTNNMVAFNRFTGDVVWSSEAMKDTFSYCSPIFVELPERKVIITHSRHNLYAVDCSNGKALGAYELKGFEWDGEHCNSPIYDNGFIYFIGNDLEGCGAVKLKLADNAESIDELWYKQKIRNNFNGYIKVNDKLFTTVKGNWLKALSDTNGEVVDSVKVATGSLIYADNKFICYGMNGDVNLISYQQNEFNILGKFKIKQGTEQHFSHPVLANGIMYIRHGNALMAYNIKNQE